ncbi:hypothetical protein T06_3062 [Trichinella sp. T6]|nr:hypothetical protein T06_3062 [Trichinella sp. T6]
MSDYHMNGQTLRKLQLNLPELTASTSTPSSEFLVKCSTVFWNSIRIDGFEESFKQNHSRKKQLKECFKFRNVKRIHDVSKFNTQNNNQLLLISKKGNNFSYLLISSLLDSFSGCHSPNLISCSAYLKSVLLNLSKLDPLTNLNTISNTLTLKRVLLFKIHFKTAHYTNTQASSFVQSINQAAR